MIPQRHCVLQIHPTLQCNLRCLHCYSSSGPEASGQLDPALLTSAIDDAAAEGFTAVGVSGGEPFLYRDLPTLLEQAHAVGLLTTVTSNGILLDRRRLDMLRGRTDLLAISLDGRRESHDRMRGAEGAFNRMVSRLDGVRASGIPFGFIFTLTRENVHELEWVASFALEQKARLLQIHPLEQLGRARTGSAGAGPDHTTANRAFMEVKRIERAAGNRLHVQLDLVHTGAYRDNDESDLSNGSILNPVSRPLASLLPSLVVEADGTVVPLEYGFPRRYALGSLLEAPLRRLARQWKSETYPAFRNLYRAAVAEVTRPDAPPFTNFSDVIADHASTGRAGRLPAGELG